MYRTSLALPFALLPGLAHADLTPEDVWSNIIASYAAIGMDVAGETTRSGETLTVTGGSVSLTYPIIGGQATATLPQMGLIAQGDGTVRILTPDTYLIELVADIPQEDGQVRFDLAIAQQGMDSIVSGDPGDVTYTTDVASFDMLLSGLDVPGMDLSSASFELESDGYSGVTRITEGDGLTLTSTMDNRATRTRMVMDIEGMQQEQTSTGGSVITQSTIVLPADINIMNLTSALLDGLSAQVTAQAEASSSVMQTYMDGTLVQEQVQNTGPSNMVFGISADGLAMSGDVGAFDASITQPDLIPFPIDVTGDGVDFEFAMPLVASDSPQQAVYAISLAQLAISDNLWGMFDPAAGLDRSPIDFAIDVRALLDWDLDVFNMDRWVELDQSGEIPVAILSAEIPRFLVSTLGGVIEGSGSFTFDNSDMDTFDGFPRPQGTAKVTATGLNAVIDQLVGAGLLPQEQASMGQMFMGIFARSTGADALESVLEVNAEGHVLLNGQRMR